MSRVTGVASHNEGGNDGAVAPEDKVHIPKIP